ncbi:NrsF family protein [Tabrizicola aquatica]|uniref:NrsF family protein n=1 Tax=Tabrizicola aquatica TaxID=909926 RepID=UPI000CD18ED9|nr:DUF1109 domain-containing protein [Tabrizicola aquatica]
MSDRSSTEALIRQLAAAPAPVAFRPAVALSATVVLVGFVLVLFLQVFGLRADLVGAWAALPAQAKTLLPLALSVLAGWLALRMSRPEGQGALWPLAIPAGLALAMVLQRLTVAEGPLLVELVGQTAMACLVSISVLSALPLAAGVILLRRGATTRPRVTGALLGLAVASAMTAGYALHCPEDSPLFFVTWYGLGILIVTGIGAALGHRFLRW